MLPKKEEIKMRIGERGCRRRNEILMIVLLGIVTFGKALEAAPTRLDLQSRREEKEQKEESLMENLPLRNRQSAEVGNPSELAWQAWLLVDGNTNPQTSGVLDSASLLRRITPKSIFIAPALTACAEGYQADTMNRCVKDVSIDSEAHRGFLVERLNAIFAHAAKPQFSLASSSSSSSSASSSSSSATGPLQLNIPLLMPTLPKETSDEQARPGSIETEDDDEETSAKGQGSLNISPLLNRDNVSQEAIVTVYELDEPPIVEESLISSQNKSDLGTDKNAASINPTDQLVGKNDKNSSPDEIFSSSDSSDASQRDEDAENADEKSEVSSSPTVVLLLSPTNHPSSPVSGNNDVIVRHDSSLGKVIIKMENVTGNVTGKEIIRVSMAESLPHPSSATLRTTIKSPQVERDTTAYPTNTESSFIIISDDKKDSIDDSYEENVAGVESTEIYDQLEDENYDESTEFDDEILKHSEAGLAVTLTSIWEKSSPKSSTPRVTTAPSTNYDKTQPKEASSKISSQVSINPDFVRETTLVDFNPTKLQISSTSLSTAENSTINNYTQETTTPLLPQISKEFPETPAASMDNPKNDKRDGHVSGVHGFFKDSIQREEIRDEPKLKSQVNFTVNANSNLDSNLHTDSSVVSNTKNVSDSNSKPSNNSNDDIHQNSRLTVDTMASDHSDEEKPDDSVNPVRGIEEALEDSLSVDNSSSTEKADENNAETMVAASTNVAGTIISGEKVKFGEANNERRRGGQPFRFSEDEKTTTQKPIKIISGLSRPEGIYDYEIPSGANPPNRANNNDKIEEDAPPIIRTIADGQRYNRPEVNYQLPSASNSAIFFPPYSHQRDEGFVRFPNNENRDKNVVRFPSDEANSISNEYKERNRRPYPKHEQAQTYKTGDEENTRTNLLPDLNGKESYWWLPSEWRNDRQHQNHPEQSAEKFPQRYRGGNIEQRARDRSPMLLRFWTKMPLVRDPSLSYPTRFNSADQYRQLDDLKSSIPSPGQMRRVNYYRGVTRRDTDGVFSNNKPLIDG